MLKLLAVTQETLYTVLLTVYYHYTADTTSVEQESALLAFQSWHDQLIRGSQQRGRNGRCFGPALAHFARETAYFLKGKSVPSLAV